MGNPGPVCHVTDEFVAPNQKWGGYVRIHCDPQKFLRCHSLWKVHITKDQECALRDIDKEWRADEVMWADRYRFEARKKRKAAQEAKRIEEERDKEKKKKAKLKEKRRMKQERERKAEEEAKAAEAEAQVKEKETTEKPTPAPTENEKPS